MQKTGIVRGVEASLATGGAFGGSEDTDFTVSISRHGVSGEAECKIFSVGQVSGAKENTGPYPITENTIINLTGEGAGVTLTFQGDSWAYGDKWEFLCEDDTTVNAAVPHVDNYPCDDNYPTERSGREDEHGPGAARLAELTAEGDQFVVGPKFQETFTIAIDQSVSDVQCVNRVALATLIMPDAWTAANITYLVAEDRYGTYGDYMDKFGNEYSDVVDADDRVDIEDRLASVLWVKLRSGTSAVPVAQAAERVIILQGKG